MNITTTAPIGLEDLKKYFVDKTITFDIDFKNSTLKEQKLLTYLSNLNIACNIPVQELDEDTLTLLRAYLHSHTIVSIPSLERLAIHLLLEYKGLVDTTIFADFIKENQEIINSWVIKLDSLVLFNTYTINDPTARAEVESFPHDDTDSTVGINFVSILKYEEFFLFYNRVNPANYRFFTRYFEENMFKGENLYSYWANPSNPMYLITWGILSQHINKQEWDRVLTQAAEEQI